MSVCLTNVIANIAKENLTSRNLFVSIEIHNKKCFYNLFLILSIVLNNIEYYNWKDTISIFLYNYMLFKKKYRTTKLKILYNFEDFHMEFF